METQAGNGRPHPEREYTPRFRTIRLHRSGNSLGLYVPRSLARQLGWGEHEELKAYIVGRVLCLQAAARETFLPGVVAVAAAPPAETGTEG